MQFFWDTTLVPIVCIFLHYIQIVVTKQPVPLVEPTRKRSLATETSEGWSNRITAYEKRHEGSIANLC